MSNWYEYNRGDHVRVVSRDDTFCRRQYLNHVGEIVALSYGGWCATIGESREDPLATVRFASGCRDAFFLTELRMEAKGTPLTTPTDLDESEDGELYLYAGGELA